jgi:tetratricopeptide (TPR) repeat protein
MNRLEQLLVFLKDQPNDNFLRYALAQEYFKIGEIEKTKTIYETLVNDSPDYSATYFHLGKLYEKMNLTEDAMQCYKNGIEVTFKNGEAHAKSELQAALLELEYDDLI